MRSFGAESTRADDLYSDCDWILVTHAPLTKEQYLAARAAR